MFFNTKPKQTGVRVNTDWYGLTERWWPACFWIKCSLEAKARRVSMRHPDKMRELIAEMERNYGESLLITWPWVKDIQRRRKEQNG